MATAALSTSLRQAPGQGRDDGGTPAREARAVRLCRRNLAAGDSRDLQGPIAAPIRFTSSSRASSSWAIRTIAATCRPVRRLAAIHDPDNALPIAAEPQHGFARSDRQRRARSRTQRHLPRRASSSNRTIEGFWEYCVQAAAGIQRAISTMDGRHAGVRRSEARGPLARWFVARSLPVEARKRGTRRERHDARARRRQTRAQASSAVSTPPIAAAQLQQPPRAASARRPVKVERTKSFERPVAISSDNDFLFGEEDPQGLRCPFGAHIRRANPRESFEPGSQEQLAITNRHRILRVGRRYAPGAGRNPGLFFMCLNADLERAVRVHPADVAAGAVVSRPDG